MTNDQLQSNLTDFELEVRRDEVRVRTSPVGETVAAFQSPFDTADHTLLRKLRAWIEQSARVARTLSDTTWQPPAEDTPQEVGMKLFEALFPGPIRTCYDSSRAVMRERRGGLRLKLRLAPELEQLPWELLYDPREDYLALTPNLSLVRYSEAPLPARAISVSGPLRVLLVAGWPDQLDLADEIAKIQNALTSLDPSLLRLDVLERATIGQLTEWIGQETCHVVHYLGHSRAPDAARRAQLLLSDEAGEPDGVPIELLWRVLRRNDNLRLVWLNSCSGAEGQSSLYDQSGILSGKLSSAAAWLVSTGLPAVLANQVRISDVAARRLAQAFYRQLASYKPIDLALAEARLAVHVAQPASLEWATPVLYMRSPDGILFQRPPEPVRIEPEARPNVVIQGDLVHGDYIFGDKIGGRVIPGDKVQYAEQNELSRRPSANPTRALVEQQLTALEHRLRQRQLQANPEAQAEIEDLKRQIASLRQVLDQI